MPGRDGKSGAAEAVEEVGCYQMRACLNCPADCATLVFGSMLPSTPLSWAGTEVLNARSASGSISSALCASERGWRLGSLASEWRPKPVNHSAFDPSVT